MRRTRPVKLVNTDAADEQRAPPRIDDSQLLKPVVLTLGRPATLTVDVSGVPPPIVQWLVGRRRVKESARWGHVEFIGYGTLGNVLRKKCHR